jgi:hypothetical protein
MTYLITMIKFWWLVIILGLEILTDETHIMPTCSLAHLRLQIIRWSDIDHVRTKGELVDIWMARDLKC